MLCFAQQAGFDSFDRLCYIVMIMMMFNDRILCILAAALSVGYESSKRASPLCSSSSANNAQRLGPNGYSLSTGLLLL